MRATFAAVVLMGCGLPDEADTQTAVDDLHRERAELRVATSETPPMHWAKTAVISNTDELVFVADVTVPSGQHIATFEIDDENGNLYQRDDVTFDRARVMDTMPVNGTWISQYDMRGTWSCHLYIDGSSAEAAHALFTLR